jgi:hypothetical protein
MAERAVHDPEVVTTLLRIPAELHKWIKEQSGLKGTFLRREMIHLMEDGRKFREKRK